MGHVARKAARRNLEVGVGCGRKDDAVGHDDLDSRVHDRVALDEIALYAEVLTAVAISERRLTLVRARQRARIADFGELLKTDHKTGPGLPWGPGQWSPGMVRRRSPDNRLVRYAH